jgi:hypothetical protein
MVAVVHLVTLGWITSSILGALHIVGPVALRAPLVTSRVDYAAFGSAAVGVTGMVSHFWIDEPSGMAWSALLMTAAILWTGARTARPVARAPIQGAVKAHVGLAFLNLAGAATLGILIGVDKVHPFLPGAALARVLAHAHLAAIGWVLMLVTGLGYRLLPMVLPAAMPDGPHLYASAVLLEIGAVGSCVGLLTQAAWLPVAALAAFGGVAAFLAEVLRMLRNPRPPPADRRRPDYAAAHVLLALAWLAAGAGIGMTLALAPTSEVTLRGALVYGVLVLIGALAQLVIGVEARLLPMFVWYWAFERTGFLGPRPSPRLMGLRRCEAWVFGLWLFAVPVLAAGFFTNWTMLVAAGGWALAAATVLGAINAAAVVGHVRPPSESQAAG